jgi:glycosyltransferase EpsH
VSVEKQTLREIEVIMIDDHGSDDSISLAQAFVARSKRQDIVYRFIETPQNSGPAFARNLGIKEAQGEYVAFLDADDWIEPEMYETLYANAKAEDADLSCCNLIQDFEDGTPSKVLRNPHLDSGEFTNAAKKHFLNTYVSYFTSFIYRREWLLSNELLFAETKSAEDSSFLACCILAAERIAQKEEPYYHYIIHSGSLTQRKVWKGREKRKAFAAVIDFAKRKKMLCTYWPQLFYIYLKKALLVPIYEMIK